MKAKSWPVVRILVYVICVLLGMLAGMLVQVHGVCADEGFPAFSKPAERMEYHLDRIKDLSRAKEYKAAYEECATLIANGGGTKKILKQLSKLQKKAKLSDEEAESIREGITASGPSAHPMVEYKSKHYVLTTNIDEDQVEEVLARFEGLLDMFHEIFGKHIKTRRLKRLKVAFYRNRTDYDAYLGEKRHDREPGFYRNTTQTIYFYGEHDQTWETLCHEGTHQIFHQALNQNATGCVNMTHFWAIEAPAIHMEGLVWEGGKYTWPGICKTRALDYRAALKEGNWMPVAEFVLTNCDQSKSKQWYAQTAVMAAYFMSHEELAKPFLKYVQLCGTGKSRTKIEKQTFGKPIAEILTDLNEWFKGLEEDDG